MPNLPWAQVLEAGQTASLAAREGYWMRLSLATMLNSQPGSRVALTVRRADGMDTPYAVSSLYEPPLYDCAGCTCIDGHMLAG
jgi:hypothetical protein